MKTTQTKIEKRYIDGSYLDDNPDWDRKDAVWKSSLVETIIKSNNVPHEKICEVGCGSGDILVALSKTYKDSFFLGFDIAPQLVKFWNEHLLDQDVKERISFQLGNFSSIKKKEFDILLLLDVFEHVRAPFTFLETFRKSARFFIFHIPLDLSAVSVIRGYPLLKVRRKVGHLHYYTKDLALETLRDCGYEILQWNYTGASLFSPNRNLLTKIASIPRKLLFTISRDIGVRIMGGDTLIVLAKNDL